MSEGERDGSVSVTAAIPTWYWVRLLCVGALNHADVSGTKLGVQPRNMVTLAEDVCPEHTKHGLG